jgi:hypothetical protein
LLTPYKPLVYQGGKTLKVNPYNSFNNKAMEILSLHCRSIVTFKQWRGSHMSKNFDLMIPELDNAKIRRTPDGRCSVYDLIAVVGGQKDPFNVWKRLGERYPEVLTKCQNFKFSGRGQRETPVTDLKGWAYILGLLPGIMGHRYRESAASLVTRYLDADITIAEDIVERNDNDADLERLEARIRGKKIRKQHTRILMARGVKQSKEFAKCTNQTYSGLYGTNAAGLRLQKGLPVKANVRNHMNTTELIEVGFSENLSTRKIFQGSAYGCEECGSVNYSTAQKVAELIRETLAS